MTKRFVGLVLALCLVVGLLPMAAFADTTHVHTPTGAGTELVDQRVDASITLGDSTGAGWSINSGKYVFQHICSECGQPYTEEKTFQPAILDYLPLSAEGATTRAWDFGTQWADNYKTRYAPRLVITAGQTLYFTTEGGHATFTENRYMTPLTDEAKIAAGEWNVKFEYPLYGDPVMTLKNAKIINGFGLWYGIYGYKDLAPLTVVLEGQNEIKHTGESYTKAGLLSFRTTNPVTITGTGSLDMEARTTASIVRSIGDLTINDVAINIRKHDITALTSTSSPAVIQSESGNININRADIDINASAPKGKTGAQKGIYAAKTLTVSNANIFAIANVSGAGHGVLHAADIVINESDLQLAFAYLAKDGATGNRYGDAINYTGTIQFNYAAGFVAHSKDSRTTYDPAATPAWSAPADLNEITDVADLTKTVLNYYYFDITHNCAPANDDYDCTTPASCGTCGTAIGTAQTAHTPGTDDGDCTTAILCANPGCQQIATPAAAAHTPEADDGDCTTAIKCSVCGKETTPAAASHTAPANRTSCDVAADCTVCGTQIPAGQHTGGTATCKDKAVCTVCSQPYGELAAHTGGTATCKDKAKCDVCGQEYGELSTTHVPAADDKDCTTAVACTLCGGEAVAAKTHAYTNAQDTTCDNEGCEHTRVVEPKPEFKISFATAAGGSIPSSTGVAVLKMNAGDPTKYYITGNFDANAPTDYFTKELTDEAKIAAGEWNIKVEYAADGIPTVTLKGAFIQNKGALQFGGWNAPYEGPTKLIIESDSIINSGYGNKSTLRFTTKGQNDDVTITSVNNAKLTLISNTNSASEAAIKANGNLILDNVNIEVVMTEYYGVANGIYVNGGNLTIKGGKLKVSAWDDSSKTGTEAEGEERNYLLNVNAALAGIKATKDAENEAKAGNVTIEGNADVSLAISVGSNAADAEKRVIATDGVFTIKDSTVEIGLIGKCVDGAKLFSVKPTLEFANNAYTVTATKTKKPTVTTTDHELDKWARIVVMTPDESKLVNWAETTGLGSITYFKVVAGGSGSGSGSGSGTGTGSGSGSNNPNTGDVSILLTAAIALSSAVGFAGVTVLRKKEF